MEWVEVLLILYFILTETFTCGTCKHKQSSMQGIQCTFCKSVCKVRPNTDKKPKNGVEIVHLILNLHQELKYQKKTA